MSVLHVSLNCSNQLFIYTVGLDFGCNLCNSICRYYVMISVTNPCDFYITVIRLPHCLVLSVH